jgi:hypothetical protein
MNSASSSKALSETPKRARRSRVARDIVSGPKDAVAFSRGTLSLHVRAVDVPGPVDVRALRMRNNPRDWRIEDLGAVADRFGIGYRQHGASHVAFKFPAGAFPVPAARPINPVYIRRFVAQVDDTRRRETQ